MQNGCFYLHFGISSFVYMAHASGKIFLRQFFRLLLFAIWCCGCKQTCLYCYASFVCSWQEKSNRHQTTIQINRKWLRLILKLQSRPLQIYTSIIFISPDSHPHWIVFAKMSAVSSLERQMHICGNHFEVMMRLSISFIEKLLSFILSGIQIASWRIGQHRRGVYQIVLRHHWQEAPRK